MAKIKRVLISVTDKKGIVEFAKGLKGFGVEILSTGGTAAQIKAAGIDVTDVSAYTGFPEMMHGRLKTLHPKVHGGLLAIRDNEEHGSAAKTHGIEMIDLVVRHPERAHFFMPPWAGAPEEADLLREYLQSIAEPFPPGLPDFGGPRERAAVEPPRPR